MEGDLVNNADAMMDGLSRVYADLRSGAIKPHEADSAANVAGKMINIVKQELAYCLQRDEKPELPFFEDAKDVRKKRRKQ